MAKFYKTRLSMCPVCANVATRSVFQKEVSLCRICDSKQVDLGKVRLQHTIVNGYWDEEAETYNARIYQRFFREVIEPMGRLSRRSPDFRRNYAFIFQTSVDYTPEEREELSREAERITRRIEERVKREEATRPRCPTCTSTDIRKIGTAERGVSAVTLGVMSNKVGKTFQCNHCGYTW